MRDLDRSLDGPPVESTGFSVHLDPVVIWEKSKERQCRANLSKDLELQPSNPHVLLGVKPEGSKSKSPMLTIPLR